MTVLFFFFSFFLRFFFFLFFLLTAVSPAYRPYLILPTGAFLKFKAVAHDSRPENRTHYDSVHLCQSCLMVTSQQRLFVGLSESWVKGTVTWKILKEGGREREEDSFL